VEPKYVREYMFFAGAVPVHLNGKDIKIDIHGRKATEEEHSDELIESIRHEVVRKTEQEHGVLINPKKVTVELELVLPVHLARGSTYKFSRTLPGSSAKVRIMFRYQSSQHLEHLMCLEEPLDEYLREDDLGYVDGNELGSGEYEIFCYGPKKAPLLDAVNEWLSANVREPYRIR